MNHYLEFYGLKEDPFRITPDPEFYYPSQDHIVALNSLNYTMEHREGFCLLTGEPGTGKTTLLKIFLEKWKGQAEIALILTPRLEPEEFLLAVLDDFNVDSTYEEPSGILAFFGKNEMLKALRNFLLENSSGSKRVAIVVDEAQNLPLETMEELRLLSNMETDKEKLLQIILVGQPELQEIIESKSSQLKQLNQRITVRPRLKRLSASETVDYLTTRLLKAGSSITLIDSAARDEIFRLSSGIPRMINVITSRAIMTAYLKSSPVVQKQHVTMSQEDSGTTNILTGFTTWIRNSLPYATLFVVILAVTVATFILLRRS